jgi:TldD protein
VRTALCTITASVLLLASAVTALGEADGPIFRAMQDELDRSMSGLRIEGMPAPYFLSYAVEDVDRAIVQARYGALVHSQRTQERYLSIECRVGDSEFDNTYFIASWDDMSDYRKGVAEEDDYDALRHSIWLHTDAAYKKALEQLAGKDAYIQTHPRKDAVPDFTPAKPLVHMGDPAKLVVDVAAWEEETRAAGDVLAEFASLQDWKVTFSGTGETRRYLNSEGGNHLKGATFSDLEVAATAQAADGQRLTSFLRYSTRGGDPLPTGEELAEDLREMARELEAVVAAETIDEYAGPVLFADYAAAQLVGQLFAAQLSPVKSPLVGEEWMKQYLPDPKLAGRLNRRVLPEFVTVTDEPTRKSWDGRNLAGHMTIDDEGVPSEDLTLVEGGRLVALPMGRGPTKKLPASNGHAIALPNQWTVPVATNVVVKTSEPKKDLVKELRKLCADFDNEYGLLVTRLDDPGISRRYRWTEVADEPGSALLNAPLIAYKVYEADGRMEPVRGVTFDDVTIRALRDIVAMDGDPALTNLVAEVGGTGLRYRIAVVTPDILVEEMELKSASAGEPMMVGARP